MTEATLPTAPDLREAREEPTRPLQLFGVLAASAASLAMGAMLAGSALGVREAQSAYASERSSRVAVVTSRPAATPATAPATQETNPETAGDGVMDELDDGRPPPPSPGAGASAGGAGGAMAGALAAAVAPLVDAGARRATGRMVTSDSVPEGPAQGYVEGRPVRIVVTRLDGKPVENRTAAAYRRMHDAAARDRVRLRIVSGFRTMEHQQALYRAWRRGQGNLAAVPGRSNHQSGHALDLNTSSPGVLRWLERNARRFGFRRTVPTEPWHWEWW